LDKNLYQNGFFTVKLGPFLDNGAVVDSSAFSDHSAGSGILARNARSASWKSLTIVVSYGRDLRGGRNVFYGTVLR